ncbi:uncharacterized protein LOC142769088 isoform X2 [Rhipicephalus microplus]|uniref:uncharacterized protein LOC142769088 isoform X2 n=1 Tax=Rhipicephalus microplus TaxID=6941 RepID=UPI003F6D00DE
MRRRAVYILKVSARSLSCRSSVGLYGASTSEVAMIDVPSTSAGQSVGGTATKSSSEDKAARRRARDAERKRRRRAEDAQLREREAAERRQRRAAAPDSAALKRKRRQEDPDFRKREAECKRRRREADPDAARERKRAEVAAWRAKQYATPNARFKRDFLDRSFGHTCKASSKSAAASTRESRLPDEDGVSVAMTRPADSCSKRIDSKSEMQVGAVMVEIGKSLNSSACPESSRKLAESSQPSRRGVDVAVETPRISDQNLCKSSQASVVPIRIHRWTETTPLVHFMVLKLQQKCD